MACISEKQRIAFVTETLLEEQRLLVAHHIDHCESCLKQVEEIRQIHDALRPETVEFDDPELKGEIMNLIDLGRGESERLPKMSKGHALRKWGSIAAAAAVIPFVIVLYQFSRDVPSEKGDGLGFTSRGAGESLDRWVSLELFERMENGGNTVYEPVEERLGTHSTLAFAYEDRGQTPYSYLMVLAVTSGGEILWYYPEEKGQNETNESIHIGDKGGRVTLSEEVTLDLAVGEIRFFGLFSHAPLKVKQVEKEVEQALSKTGELRQMERLALKGAGQWSKLLRVTSTGD